MNRRSRSLLLAALSIISIVVSPAISHADPAPGVTITEVSRRPHPDLPDKEIVVQRVELAAGAAAHPHLHPGTVTGYVISGRLEFQVKGEPLLHLKAGDTFYEPAGSQHLIAKNPDAQEKTVIVAFVINPKGEAVAKPLPDAAPTPR